MVDKGEPLHPLEWIDGLDPAIYLSVTQVFRQNLIAPDGFGSGKQERVVKLKSLLLPNLQRSFSPPSLLIHNDNILKGLDISSNLVFGHC